MSTHRWKRGGTAASAALAVLAASAVTAGPALASSLQLPLPTSAPASCAATSLSEPFSSWGDDSQYRLVPGGDFSDGAPGWSLTGGAKLVSGTAPYNLTGAAAPGSLSLPAGATAQTPFTCVDGSQPTFRFLEDGAALGTSLQVSVVYQTLAGLTIVAPSGLNSTSGAWSPSPILQTSAQIASLPTGGTAQMALRFQTLGGAATIDDVFVDPRMHGP